MSILFRKIVSIGVCASFLFVFASVIAATEQGDRFMVEHSESEWKALLTPEQYNILRKKGTERADTGEYNHYKGVGTYHCAGCGQALFKSNHKYDSKTGWPSFWQPIDENAVNQVEDRSGFMKRIELICSRCGSHLGHVFSDGPPPTGLRYCINSLALNFKK